MPQMQQPTTTYSHIPFCVDSIIIIYFRSYAKDISIHNQNAIPLTEDDHLSVSKQILQHISEIRILNIRQILERHLISVLLGETESISALVFALKNDI